MLYLLSLLGGLIYRVRGGVTWFFPGRSQINRALWAVTTAVFVTLVWDASPLAFACFVLSFFLSMAMIGHGGHMVIDIDELRRTHFSNPAAYNETELLTDFWLPKLFGGLPGPDWPIWRTYAFHMFGMSAIGLVRNAVAMLPAVFFLDVQDEVFYALAGLLHGPLYWLGWRIPLKVPGLTAGGSQNGELLVGTASWLTLAVIFAA